MRTPLLLCLATTGCVFIDQPAPAPVFPPISQVSKLTVVRNGEISDPVKVEHFMSALHSLQGKWSFTWHTYPTPQATVALGTHASSKDLCLVDIGPNWLGSTCGHTASGWPPFTSLTREQAVLFRGLVGGTWEVK